VTTLITAAKETTIGKRRHSSVEKWLYFKTKVKVSDIDKLNQDHLKILKYNNNLS